MLHSRLLLRAIFFPLVSSHVVRRTATTVRSSGSRTSMASSPTTSNLNSKINLLDLAAACVACTETASTAILKIAQPVEISSADDDDNNNNNASSSQKNTRLKPDGSFVTDADFAAQGVIVQAVRTVSEDIAFLGEESAEEMAAHVGQHAFLDEKVLERTRQELRLRLYQQQQRHQTTNNVVAEDEDYFKLPLAQSAKASDEVDPKILEILDGLEDPEDCWVEASRLAIIVDPLDGTKSYAHGEYDAVSILICIVLDHQPYFGVIGKPFGYLPDAQLSSMLDTSCVTIYGGPFLNGVYVAGGKKLQPSRISSDVDNLPRAVISGSRSKGVVHDFCVHLGELGLIDKEPMLISGAGEKSLRLILQINNEALWFYPKSGTSLWDVAAPDALLRSLGGKLTDKFGNTMDYTKPRAEAENMEGVVACIDAELHAKCIELFKKDDWVHRR